MSSDTRHHYQPTITRLPSLLCLLFASLGLIALVEIACRRLPAHNANGIITSVHDTASADISSIIEARHVKRLINGTEDPSTTEVGAPPPTDFLPIDQPAATSSTTLAPAPSDFLPIDEPAATSSTTVAPAPSEFLPIDTSTPPQPAPATSAFIPINPSPATITPANSPVTVGAPAPTNFLPLDNSNAAATSVNTPTNLLPVDNSNTPATSVNIVTTPATPTPYVLSGIVDGVPYTLEGGVAIVGGYFLNTASPTTATLSDGHIVVVGPTGEVSIQDLSSQQSPGLTPRDYVVGAFIPTILAVLFTIPWHLLTSAIKEIEPFYQLHNGDGISAEDSLMLNYRASVNVVATVAAVRKRHYLVWWSGVLSLIILLLPPLASETVFIGFVGAGRCTATSGRQACIPELSYFPIAARVVQGILAFIAVLTCALAVAILQRKSGVFANPLSIAGIATLFQDQRLIEDFRRINPYANSKEIRNSLRGNRYRLGTYSGFEGNNHYGMTLVHSNPLPGDDDRRTSFGGKKYASVAVNPVEEFPAQHEKKPSSRPWVHPAAVLSFALFVLGLMILIMFYYFVGTDSGFERFMSSDAFGVSFLFTAIGVILKMYWSLLDDEIRNMEPYRQLLHGSAKPRDSILLAPYSNPFTGFFHSISHGHFFNSYISLVAVLCEPLIVALANIPFKPGTAYKAYQVATWISVLVLVMMLVGIIWFLCRKKTPGMIRRPDTIVDVLLYICGSHMLGDFRGMGQLDRRTRDDIVRDWDKRYSMGRLVGVDGVEREGVDESVFVGQVPRDQ